ncbi:MAG: PIN domain-containing protein [Candidatus Hodarchaeota archaeon]
MKSNTNLIVIDSNFILLPFQFKIDFFNEIRLKIEGKLKFIIFQQVLNELESKRKRDPKATDFARFLDSGLSYLERNKDAYNIEILENCKENNETTDDFLIRMLKDLKKESQNVYLATNDSDLRKKVKKEGISIIFLRQKKYLSIDRA